MRLVHSKTFRGYMTQHQELFFFTITLTHLYALSASVIPTSIGFEDKVNFVDVWIPQLVIQPGTELD